MAHEFNEAIFWYNVHKWSSTRPDFILAKFLEGRPYFNGILILPFVLPIPSRHPWKTK